MTYELKKNAENVSRCLARTMVILILHSSLFIIHSFAQDTLCLSLNECIATAQSQSSDALAAKHQLEAAEWNYRYHQANYLPAVTLTSSPSLNRQVSSITQPDGTNIFMRQNQLSTDLALSIKQNVALTGGTLFLSSSLYRQDEFE